MRHKKLGSEHKQIFFPFTLISKIFLNRILLSDITDLSMDMIKIFYNQLYINIVG